MHLRTFVELLVSSTAPELRGELGSLDEAEAEVLLIRAGLTGPDAPPAQQEFARYLGARLTRASLSLGLDAIRIEELALCFRALRGERSPSQKLERHFLQPALGASGADDDVAQRVREKLLVGERARLGEFEGRGPLAAWLRSVVRREQASHHRGITPDSLEDDALDRLEENLVTDPELAIVKGHLRAHLKAALAAALDALTPAERELLRMFHLEGLPHGKIGEALSTPRSTVAHRLEKARARLLSLTRAQLAERHALDESEVDSVIALARSQLDLTLSLANRLAPSPEEP